MVEKVQKKHRGASVDRVGDFDIIECVTCGFTHVVPLPTSEVLENIYRNEYYSEVKPEYFRNTEEDRSWWELAYDDRLRILESALPADRRRLLDIGSGPGLFLDRARERGWTAVGVEPSLAAAEYSRARNHEVIAAFFDAKLGESLSVFDAINLSNVLEHVSDPAGILKVAVGLLGEGGLLSICVPNDYNPLQKTLRGVRGFSPWWLAVPHHLNYFTFDSLEKLLRRLGLSPIARSTSFPMDMLLLLGYNYINNPDVGRECHRRRKDFEFALEEAGNGDLRRSLYQSLARLGIGREAIVIAQKAQSATDFESHE